jgi:two-component system, OmpR family, sensor histidine kinase MprB
VVSLRQRIDGAKPVVEVSVKDRGPGITAEDFPKIFDRFYRSTIHRDRPGSGLGLAIVASAAESHHGHAQAINNPNEPGTTFTLSLPTEDM